MNWRRALLALTAALLLVAAVGLAYVLYVRHAARDIVGSSTEQFVTTNIAPTRPKTTTSKRPGIEWPQSGYSPARVRISPYLQRPPYRLTWGFPAHSLVEFAPVVGFGDVYFANEKGTLFAVHVHTGRLAWKFNSGRAQAASPALAGRTIFHTFMQRNSAGRGDSTGEIVALDALTGKLRWRHTLAPSESSPLVLGGVVYVGDWSGRVYAFDEKTGRIRWTYKTGDAVKGGVAASGARLFVGSYDHHIYSLDTRTGRLLWRGSVQERLGSLGRFYATPAVAYGRVYVGATDGKVYSFGASSGQLLWSRSTGSYVYGSPAIWQRRVYVGSYDGNFYALNAATGEVVWRFAANGPISGSATVIGGLVYFSSLRGRTYALDAATGDLKWTFRDGAYAGVINDAARLYVVGFGRLYAFVRTHSP
jgi:outer membrane protein assembly factor BamB